MFATTALITIYLFTVISASFNIDILTFVIADRLFIVVFIPVYSLSNRSEFVMDLDGHKSVIMSLNVIGRHLADHTRDIRRAENVRSRLDAANKRWEGVCLSASLWQAKLQEALMGNTEFHNSVTELLVWTEEKETAVHNINVDESDDEILLRERVHQLLDIRAEAERIEPRVASLHQAAQQLLHTHDDNACIEMRERLAVLSRRLQLLLQICSQKLVIFSQMLGYDFTQSLASLASTGIAGLEYLKYCTLNLCIYILLSAFLVFLKDGKFF
ncbi:hypothetical protein Avbf_03381 [Armadillidium vulgare]|nr:hypothetical protein Avbf_03381 [Armadillidium vulgare]